MRESRDPSVELRHDDPVADDAQSLQTGHDRGGLDRIPQLSEQAGERLRVLGPRVPNQRAWITTGAHGCPVMSVTIRPCASFGVTVSVCAVTVTSA